MGIRWLAFALILPAQEKESFLPTQAGVSRTFRHTRGERVTEVVRTTEELGKTELRLVDPVEDDPKQREFREFRPEGAEFSLIREGEEILHVIRSTRDEIRIYSHAWEKTFHLSHSVKSDLREGMKWTSRHLYLSCGWGVAERSYATAAERVTVPAGTFDAIRVDMDTKVGGKEALWLVRGQGVVKWEERHGTLELLTK